MPGLIFHSTRPPGTPPSLSLLIGGMLACSLVANWLAPDPWSWSGELSGPRVGLDSDNLVSASGPCAAFEIPVGRARLRSAEIGESPCDSVWRLRWKPGVRPVAQTHDLALDARWPTEWVLAGLSFSTDQSGEWSRKGELLARQTEAPFQHGKGARSRDR